tara:strand:+ start:538 stop:948 length:411 start_codon:yes stop_codon:yes gene_type:complete
MADLNKLRQTNPHWQPEDGDIDPVQKLLTQQTEEYKEWANKANKSPEMKQNRDMNLSKYTKNDLEQAKEFIIDKITKHFNDVMFEMVCEEMSESYLFQSSNYLTEAGYDVFEDEWFEFYHEHHGDILYQVMQNITN